jgi:hypothetical protein
MFESTTVSRTDLGVGVNDRSSKLNGLKVGGQTSSSVD